MEDITLNLRDYLWVIYKRRWAVIAFLVFTITAAAVYIFTAVPVYRATAQLMIEKEYPNIVDFKEIYAIDATAQDFYQTQYKLLQSRYLAKRVIKKLGDDNGVLKPAGMTGGRLNLFAAEQANEGEGIDEFLKALTVEPVRNTRLVRVHFNSANPDTAARAANEVVSTFIEHNLESRIEATYGATDFLNKKLDEQRKKLEESEMALLRYKEKYNIISMQEKENITVQKLAELNTDVLKAENSRVEAEMRYLQAKSIQNDQDMIESIPLVLTNPLINKLRTDEADLSRELSELSEKYGEKHPKIITIREKLNSTRQKLGSEVKKVINFLKNEYEVALAKERSLKEAFEAQKKEAQLLSKHSIAYEVLLRDVETNKQLHEILLTRLKETGITGGIQSTNVKVIDKAVSPSAPVKPRKGFTLVLSMFIGVFGGMVSAFFLESIDNTIKTPDDLKQYIKVPYLGFVPDFKEDLDEAADYVLVSLNHPKSSAAEAYRGIRTAILFSSADRTKKTLLVTSAVPQEGKSSFISNLAVTLAQSGSKTLLIDTDFRRPEIHKVFGIPKENGFSNLLIGDAGLDDVIRSTAVPGLDVITCGHIPPNPAELLGSAKMKEYMETLKNRYDRILFDSPPVLPVTDPVVISAVVDDVLLIIRAGKTSRDMSARAIEQLKDVKANLIGAALNGVKANQGRYYYQYYYYGGEEPKEPPSA